MEVKVIWIAIEDKGTIITACASVAAVFIALWQICSQRKKLKLRFSEQVLIPGKERYFCISIANTGNKNVVLTGWSFVITKEKCGWVIPDKLDPTYVELPITIKPEESINLMCKKKYLIKGMKDGIETGKMKRNAYLKLVVTDATGSHYYVKSKKKIYEYLEGVTDDV